jgi:transcriptional regulator with XRE-family HTH domain
MSDVLTEYDVREELRLLANSMSTHKALANKIGISPQYLHDILRGNRKPGRKVLAYLKLEAVTGYRERR